ISELKNYYEIEISDLKNKYYNEILQNHKNEILNLKKYYENEISNLKTYYENEILNLRNYNKSEIFRLENNYNQIKNNYNIEINLKNKQNIEIYNLKNKIFSLEQELKNPSIDLFSNIFNNNINNLSNLLYKKQYEEKCFPPTNSDEFIKMIDLSNLKPFVLMFFNAFKSNNQNEKSIEKLKIRIMLLMYHLAGLKNNKITNVKASIGSFLLKAGLSKRAINLLSYFGYISSYTKLYSNMINLEKNHQIYIQKYLQNNFNNLFIINIDDYHDCHQTRLPTMTSNNRICHMATTLINSTSNILKIPFISSNNISLFESGLISINHLNNALSNELRNNLISYNSRKLEWKNVSDILILSTESLIESLSVHMYDGTLENQHMRNFNNTKLIDFISSDLKNTDDYLQIINNLIKFSDIKKYLTNNIIITPMDFPGQLYIRKLIVYKYFNSSFDNIPKEINHFVPLLGPLHVSLNTRQTCLIKFYPFFNELYKNTFNKKKNLAAKPKPWQINLLLYIAHAGWIKIRSEVLKAFKNSKNGGFYSILNLLDDIIPSTLDIYTNLFRNNHFEYYYETIFRLWMFMRRCNRKNYDKIMLVFLSDILQWSQNQHPIIDIFYNHLNLLDEYPVENFHSLVRRSTTSKLTNSKTLRRYGIFIDSEKHENKFISNFLKTKEYLFSKPQLDSLVFNSSIFLLNFFTNFYKKQNDFKIITNKKNQVEVYIPTIEKSFEKGILPSAYHTNIIPNNNKLCDLQFCNNINSDIIILLCGHSYHTICFSNLNFTCDYCFQYYKSSIETISNNFNIYLKSDLKKKYNNDREEINNNNIIELDEDNILEDININENNIDNEFISAMNNFTTITNENNISTEFKRISIDLSNNDQNNNESIIISNKRKRDSYLSNSIQKK
ncbi:13865_t:CDS:1, partial [Cetraspora pellucida]